MSVSSWAGLVVATIFGHEYLKQKIDGVHDVSPTFQAPVHPHDEKLFDFERGFDYELSKSTLPAITFFVVLAQTVIVALRDVTKPIVPPGWKQALILGCNLITAIVMGIASYRASAFAISERDSTASDEPVSIDGLSVWAYIAVITLSARPFVNFLNSDFSYLTSVYEAGISTLACYLYTSNALNSVWLLPAFTTTALINSSVNAAVQVLLPLEMDTKFEQYSRYCKVSECATGAVQVYGLLSAVGVAAMAIREQQNWTCAGNVLVSFCAIYLVPCYSKFMLRRSLQASKKLKPKAA